MENSDEKISLAAEKVIHAKHLVAFTGAGISVESGIPPFRGENGLWSKYDPQVLDLGYFHQYPLASWKVIKEIFYDFFGAALPNAAHTSLAELEQMGLLKCVITQNIDNLHQAGGSTVVHEFHGNSHKLVCTKCRRHFGLSEVNLDILPPKCTNCNGLLKPDFIFFGEGIPTEAFQASHVAAGKADVFIIIGSTGEVSPANQIPVHAKNTGATIIEINPENSRYTNFITDIHLKGKAGEMMTKLMQQIHLNQKY